MENLNIVLIMMIMVSIILFVSGNVVNYDMNVMVEKISAVNVLPNSRDFDLDIKCVRFLVDREINNVRTNIIDAAHKSNCNKNIISEEVLNDAISIASLEVIKKLSNTQKNIIKFYIDSDNLDNFIIDMVSDNLFSYANSINAKTIKGY